MHMADYSGQRCLVDTSIAEHQGEGCPQQGASGSPDPLVALRNRHLPEGKKVKPTVNDLIFSGKLSKLTWKFKNFTIFHR